MDVIGYTRVSTEEQGADGAGMQAQVVAIAEAVRVRGWRVAAWESDTLSGRSLNRPGLTRALTACQNRTASGIVVAKLDRLSRSIVDFAGLLERAQREGWNVVALDLGVDLSTPAGEFLANVMASVAQWERRIISARTKEALAVKAAQGVVLGRPTSIEPELAARITQMRNEGQTLRAICNVLNADGVPTPRGGAVWRPSSLSSVLA
jgi:DNA invertase Pin-like site-specific DNA recombinase